MAVKKRFYKSVTIEKSAGFWRVQLDGRDLKSPAGTLLSLPTSDLASAIADEWQAQDEEIDAASMPLFALTVTVLDRVSPQCDTLIAELTAYGGNDLLCYRGEHEELAARQHEMWQPWLDRLQDQDAISLGTVTGIMPIGQSEAGKFTPIIAAYDDWRLGVLYRISTLSGSLVLGFWFTRGDIDSKALFDLAFLDELWQNENWGIDFEAADRHEYLRGEMADAARFLSLLAGDGDH